MREFFHALDILILNTFLGSFDLASTCFAEWVSWVNNAPVYGNHYLCLSVPSTPLRPAFAAAVCGLGELVSWLWHSEGADMNIKNNQIIHCYHTSRGCRSSQGYRSATCRSVAQHCRGCNNISSQRISTPAITLESAVLVVSTLRDPTHFTVFKTWFEHWKKIVQYLSTLSIKCRKPTIWKEKANV